jgi:hypothetical protein
MANVTEKVCLALKMVVRPFSSCRGDYYEGEWLEDKANGEGVYCYIDGVIYRGSWLNDLQNGNGEENWPDGGKFEGNF